MKNVFSIGSVMKQMAPVMLVSIFLLPLSARAEIKAGSIEVSPFGGYSFFEKRQNLEHSPVIGARLGYNFTDRLGIEGTWQFMKSEVDNRSIPFTREGQFTSPINDVKTHQLKADLLFHFMPDKAFNPYITAGYGVNHYSPKINDRNMSFVDFGVGAKYWLAENIALRGDVRDNLIFDEHIHNVETTLGVVFRFGGDKKAVKTAAVAPEVPATPPDKTPLDTTPPTVTFTNPGKGDTAVHINQKINVAFSEEMDETTFTGLTFTLKQGKSPVSGKLSSTNSTLTFTPAGELEKGKEYTGEVAAGAKDLAGNPMANNYLWNFTTGSVADTTAPTVSFTSPTNGSTAAPVGMKINVAFSETMDPATISATTFKLTQEKTPVSGKVSSVASNATFVPTKKLEKGKNYTGTITNGARDLAGNPVAKDYVWDFTAYAEPKVIGVLAKLDKSHFEFDKDEISENGKTILNNNVTALKGNPGMTIRVAGHSSASGTAEYNQGLSERRAAAVKNYLIKTGGIDEKRITAIGYGESNPAMHEADPSDKLSAAAHANMRVVIEIVE